MNCPGCNKPMKDGQPMNGLLKCHWDCSGKVREAMGDENANELIRSRTDTSLRQEGLFPGHHIYEKLMEGVL